MKIKVENLNMRKATITYLNDGSENDNGGGQREQQFNENKFNFYLFMISTFYVLEFGSK